MMSESRGIKGGTTDKAFAGTFYNLITEGKGHFRKCTAL